MTESYKVAMVGPTAVGKTTLVTAILDQTQGLLDGTPITVDTDESTHVSINRNRKELAKAIAEREFNPGALRNTVDMTVYEILLRSVEVPSLTIPFSVLDFPGGWLDPTKRASAPNARSRWPECIAHIKNSVMLLVPIDGAVLMEAQTLKQKGARTGRLGLVDIVDTAREWARVRNERPDEPAVLVLAPLKCEKYFADNGGNAGFDGSEIRQEVLTVYANLLSVVRKQATKRSIRIIYAPIDTYGCVELMEAIWEPLDDGELGLNARYRFRSDPPAISVKAAVTIMQELCQMIIVARDAEERAAKASQQSVVARLEARQQERKGFFGTLLYHISGEASLVNAAKRDGLAAVKLIANHQQQLAEALKRLSKLPRDERVEEW